MPPYHVSIYDQILVNAFTGEITSATYKPDGKVYSVDEAIEIVKKEFFDDDLNNQEDDYRFEHALSDEAPDHVYVILVQKNVDNHFVFYTRKWVDKYTGDIISGYYLYGKG